ncbi:MAG: pseudouridine synthase [Acidobacteriota bacterium]
MASTDGALNRGFDYRERLGRVARGLRLVDYLALRYPHSSWETWRRRIVRGRVALDDAPASPGTRLRAGQSLVWRRPPWREPDAPLAYAVLYQDEHLLAVAKPCGLPTLPSGGFLRHTLLSLVRRRDPGASPVHRLDRGGTGLVLFARTGLARSRLAAAWRDGRALRVYRALVVGSPGPDEFAVEVPIGPVPFPPLGTVHAAAPEGKPARSRVRVLERRGAASLVEITLASGRPHQARIHLAAAGHPLVGDRLYLAGGAPDRARRGRPGEIGFLLHAGRLAFPHPASGRPVALCCPPPPPLRAGAALQ